MRRRKMRSDYVKRKSPYQAKLLGINEEEHLACVLHVLCGWPAGKAWATAFGFEGSPTSVGPSSTRFFQDVRIVDACRFYAQRFHEESYIINYKWL